MANKNKNTPRPRQPKADKVEAPPFVPNYGNVKRIADARRAAIAAIMEKNGIPGEEGVSLFEKGLAVGMDDKAMGAMLRQENGFNLLKDEVERSAIIKELVAAGDDWGFTSDGLRSSNLPLEQLRDTATQVRDSAKAKAGTKADAKPAAQAAKPAEKAATPKVTRTPEMLKEAEAFLTSKEGGGYTKDQLLSLSEDDFFALYDKAKATPEILTNVAADPASRPASGEADNLAEPPGSISVGPQGPLFQTVVSPDRILTAEPITDLEVQPKESTPSMATLLTQLKKQGPASSGKPINTDSAAATGETGAGKNANKQTKKNGESGEAGQPKRRTAEDRAIEAIKKEIGSNPEQVQLVTGGDIPPAPRQIRTEQIVGGGGGPVQNVTPPVIGLTEGREFVRSKGDGRPVPTAAEVPKETTPPVEEKPRASKAKNPYSTDPNSPFYDMEKPWYEYTREHIARRLPGYLTGTALTALAQEPLFHGGQRLIRYLSGQQAPAAAQPAQEQQQALPPNGAADFLRRLDAAQSPPVNMDEAIEAARQYMGMPPK